LQIVELENRRNDLVKEFSGGMKRRLEIARGLLHHPKIIFLDEPTIGLDPQTRNHLWSYIKDMNQKEGITVFFSTHYMEEAQRMANQIAIIDNGEIVAQGTAKELQEKTATKTLEEAFLLLTGKQIREESAKGIDKLRDMRRVWKK
jgi:ABC-2 type transport system ATP-binding protein